MVLQQLVAILVFSQKKMITCPSILPWTVWKGKKIQYWETERWMPQVGRCPTCSGEEQTNNSRKNEEMEPKQKQHPVVDVTGDRSKARCCKEKYCIGTWNLRSMNQGKLEVIKQELARVNTDILGISELKWTGMGEFNSADHCIYYFWQESLRRNGVSLIINKKSLKFSSWVQHQKWQNDLCSFPRQTIQVHSDPSLCPKSKCWRSWMVLWRPTRTFRNNTQKRSFSL